jgi:ribonuclease III
LGGLELAGHDPLLAPAPSDRLSGAGPRRPGELEGRIGHRFAQPRLLRQALTHASVAGRGKRATATNERLEFLGDRVLGLVIATLLLDRFTRDSEGALTRRHAALVRRETLAEIAAGLDLGAWLEVARSEEEVGRSKPAILADALEALIGAIYLDGGLAAAQAFIVRHWAERLENAGAPPRDAKSALQEWAQGRGLALPVYEVVASEGPAHAPAFEVRARLADGPAASATAPSKRAAEQAAAALLLASLSESGGGTGE